MKNIKSKYITAIARRIAAACIAAAAVFPMSSMAQNGYPSRPITIVVSFAAGGSSDILARAIAEKLMARIGQPVIVENKPGGNTMIATNYVLQQKPDGYVLYLASSQLAEKPATNPSIAKYHPVNDFTPITFLSRLTFVLAVRPDLPVKSVQDFIDLAKTKPGGLTMATVGTGGADHLASEILSKKTGAKFLAIPYKGSSPALTDVGSGMVDARLGDYASMRPFIDGGRIKPIATGDLERSSELNLPPIAEAVPGFEVSIWFAMFGPKGMPEATVKFLNSHLVAILRMPDIRARMKTLGMDTMSSTPAELLAIVTKRHRDAAEIIKAGNLKLDN